MKIFSTVLFGSQISGGNDHQSDRDLLVVCEPQSKNAVIKMYAELGYSVSVYTPHQLECMKSHGSLFLQHLRYESRVLLDYGCNFTEFINNCNFVPPPLAEINRSKQSIINALNCPIDHKSRWWLADYLFVLSRDYFIKYFARQNQIIFNVKQLSYEIKKEFNLKEIEAETFLSLRKCKAIYRSGNFEGAEIGLILSAWKDIIANILNIRPKKEVSYQEYLFDRTFDDFESSYALLRYVESLRIMFPNTRCNKYHEQKIHKMIVNPNHYSSTSEISRRFLSLYVVEFRKKANKLLNKDCCQASESFLKHSIFLPNHYSSLDIPRVPATC